MLQTILQTDLAAWCISAAVLLFGCWLQTALGFGMAVAAAPVIVLVKPEWVPVVLTVTALQLSVINTWNQRHAVQLKPMAWAFVTRIPGTVTGAWLLVQLNVQWLQIFVAVSVILAVVLSLWSVHFEATPKRQALAGYFSGLMGTTTSIGGPPMALVMQHGEPSTIRANLSLFFTYSCILSLLSYWFADLLTVELMVHSLSFVPVALIGFYLGIQARPFVDDGRFRPLLLMLCGSAGTFALIGAFYK